MGGCLMPVIEEGVTLEDDVLECIAWLQSCFEKLEAGQEELILSEPFYARADGKPPLTDEDVDKIIEGLDAEFAFEIGSYPGYHRNRSGATHVPQFDRLSPSARRALVEGIDGILARHRAAKSET